MNAVHFGERNADIILLLHGGGLSWWNYREVARLLETNYHVVLPILDGHGGSDAPFTTIEDNAARIIRWIDNHCNRRILALCGVSLGAQIALEILSQRPDICRFALIESALFKPMMLTAPIIAPSVAISYGLIQKKWFAKLQSAYLGIPESLFDDYYRDTRRISKSDMVAFMKNNCLYAPKPGLANTSASVHITAGRRELPAMIRSAKLLHERIPGSTLDIIPGFRHGDFSLNHPAQYVQVLRILLAEDV